MKKQSWTFITNYGLVLNYLARNPRSTTRQIADAVGITERTTHKIINELEIEGYISRRRVGRRNVYRLTPRIGIGSSAWRDATVSDLLETLTSSGLWRVSPPLLARERELALR